MISIRKDKEMKLGEFKKLSMMAPNQYIIETENGKIFQSFNYVVCKVAYGDMVFLNSDWDYSKTTTRYLCQFLNVINKNLILINIKNGLYTVTKF